MCIAASPFVLSKGLLSSLLIISWQNFVNDTIVSYDVYDNHFLVI